MARVLSTAGRPGALPVPRLRDLAHLAAARSASAASRWRSIDLPVGWVFGAMLFGFALMFLRSLQVAWRHWKHGYSVLERPEFAEGERMTAGC